MIKGSGNVFLDLGFDKAEADSLKMRADLMIRIVDFYEKSGMTQARAAKALGSTQPRLNALLKGRIGLCSAWTPREHCQPGRVECAPGRKRGRVSTSHLSRSGTPQRKSAAHGVPPRSTRSAARR